MLIDTSHNEITGGLRGRQRIYTDAEFIDESNILEVLHDAFIEHENNVNSMKFLLDYEKGEQPLKRVKVIRQDIDIRVSDNIANQIVEFKLGYNWGNPIKYVQRGNVDISGKDSDKSDDAIARLNEMNDAEMASAKDQELARYVEICGIGYQFVDLKRKFEGMSPFDLITLNPMYAFKVYRNDIYQTEMLDVTFSQAKDGSRDFTCYTPDRVFMIHNGETSGRWDERNGSGYTNPLGMMPIVEFTRAYDRMGCFERHIADMDALNIEVSDFANAVAQDTQGMWWGNDFEFNRDDEGRPIKPVGGQWIMTTTTPNGKTPIIQALESRFDYSGVQTNIESKRNLILQKCYVPLQTDPGGGSTASAMSLSSGWSAAEATACKEELIIRRSKLQVIALELKAIEISPDIPRDDPLKSLLRSDIDAKFTRQKTFDLGTKVNAMVAMIKTGVHGRIAMQTVDLFPDIAQAWADSKPLIEKFQENMFEKGENPENLNATAEAVEGNAMQDSSQQKENSPLIDGMEVKTKTDGTGN